MRGTVKIRDGFEIELAANAATAVRYQQVFGENLLKYFSGKTKPEDSAVVAQEMAYIMARSAEGADMTKLSREDYLSWLEQFEALDLVRSDVTDAILGIYSADGRTESAAKKE